MFTSKKKSIEIPLLSKEERSNSAANEKKTYFTEFLDPSCPPSKYIIKPPMIKYLSFFDVLPLVRTAYRKRTPLESSDLPLPFTYCNVEKKILELDAQWNIELRKSHPSITIALVKAYKKELVVMFLLGWSLVTVKIFSLPLLGNIINGVTAKSFGSPVELSELIESGLWLTGATVYLSLVVSWFWHATCVIAANMRNAVIGFVYKKLQSVTLSSVQEISVGKVVNLLSNDVNEFDKSGIYFIATVLSPYTITLGAITMWRFFGFVTIFGILGLFGFMNLSNYLSKKTQSVRSEKSAITDARIKLTNEFIECIRLIKMYAWEEAFKKGIESLRDKEAISLLKLRIMEIFSISVAATSPQSSLVIMCIIYALGGGMLSPEKIYASLMILNFVSLWAVEFFHHGVMFVSAMKVIRTRLESILFLKDIVRIEQASDVVSFKNAHHHGDRVAPVIFSNFSAWWKSDDAKPCLSDINLTLIPGQVNTVIGTIGSGKTSFLLSFLRETPKTLGQLKFEGRVAYVEQEPIIFSGTVRDNILFGREYDEQLYKTVVRACNLHDDFRQFQDGDKTVVGERGITLSGGQKARISLGRALYSQSDIYLLDDPLSAVDSKVGRHIFNYAIKGQLLKEKVVILVTHHLNYAKESDRVLLFSEGRIIGDGSFEELRSTENALFSKFKEIEDEEEKRKSSYRESTMIKPSEKDHKKKEDEEKSKQFKGEEENHPVTFKTYLSYVKENDSYKTYFSLIVFSFLFYGGMAIFYIRVLGMWGQEHSTYSYNKNENENKELNNAPYILATIFFALFAILGHTFKSSLVARFILNTNSTMHGKALNRLSDSKVLFFDQTPTGAILNRFSNDLGTLDSSNATLMPFVFDGCIYILLRLLTLIMLNPVLIVPTIILGYFTIKVRNFLERAVMETKRIDLTSKSPMYSEISATLNGLLAIRVFNQGGNFLKRFCSLLYTNQQAQCYMDRTFKIFAILMSMVLDSLSLLGTFMCIFVAYYTDLDAGLFGLALLMLQEIAQLGNYLIRISLIVDINMQSVARIAQYYELEPELTSEFRFSSWKTKSVASEPRGWPHSGEIKFNNIYMKYSPDLDFVLKGLTFHISKGSKIGIVGRTGAGKSSILQALFRMTEYEKMPGSSIEIDGVSIATIEHGLLRNSLSIIPQTPVVFSGTIRRNLDPFNELKDDELWQALQEVNLRDLIWKLENKLETDMTMSSSVFSAGQKQLICLARAILRKSKIIVLDEATANVDIETDDFIQRKIMERFQDCTVITIAHRLLTIANYDKVLVMDKGKAVEYNSPYLLMVEKEGDSSITRKDGLFADMVRNSGESMSKKIFDIASKKFHNEIDKF